jgi:hypothetical protein
MAIPTCKCGNPASTQDKRYKSNLLCDNCFAERRKLAAQAGDSEWFEANVPLAQMTQEERSKVGL